MKFKLWLVIICTMSLFSAPVYSHEKKISYGIGSSLSYDNFDEQSSSPVRQGSYSYTSGKIKTDHRAVKVASRFSAYTTGVALFKKSNLNDETVAYFGSRFAYMKSNNDSKSASEINVAATTGLIFQPTLGIEHYVSNNFSLGIELGISYHQSKLTTASNNLTLNSKSNTNKTSITTQGAVIFRYHFT